MGEGNGELLFDGYRVSVWCNEKVLERVVMVARDVNLMHLKCQNSQFMLCTFYHSFLRYPKKR